MRNCNARMTDELHRRLHRQRRNGSVLPKLRLFGVAACLTMYSLTASTLRASPQQTPADINSRQVSPQPIITAKPERVTLSNGTGSTRIAWNTGNGSMGFVFVTEEGGKPVLFAKSSRGSRVAAWIKEHTYVFELYGDDQRQRLLAEVTVSGSVESVSPRHPVSWQVVSHWALIIGLAAILYFTVYLSSTGAVRTAFPAEPTTSPRPLHVARNLFLGIAAFIYVDGAIFHSGLYVSILAPSSYAGRIAKITQAERERASSSLKEVLVLGDSRIAEGFSATLANELGSSVGIKFVSLAEPAASANTWYYMVRDVDPRARRYSAIIIPYGLGYEPNSADPLRISMTAPLLRYGDLFHFASGFQRWSGRFRAFVACILRGSAYQDDVVDFISHPVERIRSIQQANKTHPGSEYKGRDYDLVGTSYDATTGQVTFAPKLTETQRQIFRKSLIQPSQSDTEYSLKLQRDWIPRIMSRYSNGPTAIVLAPLPRGPFLELGGFAKGYESVLPSSLIQSTSFSLPGHTFAFLEKPEYYFDAFHLNAKGRRKFTERLVSELLERLRPGDWKTEDQSGSQLPVNGTRAMDKTK